MNLSGNPVNLSTLEPLLSDWLKTHGTGYTVDREIVQHVLRNLAAGLTYHSPNLVRDALTWWVEYGFTHGINYRVLDLFLDVLEKELSPIETFTLKEVFISTRKFLQESAHRVHPLSRHAVQLCPEARDYLNLVLAHEGDLARERILNLASSGESIRRIYLKILQPVLIEIGRMWQENEVGVEDEHYGTALTQIILVELHPFVLRSSPLSLGRAIFCSVGDEYHEFGVRMVADFFEMEGWDTYYFGANLPSASLCNAVMKYEPDLVAVSVTLAENLPALEETMRDLRSCTLQKPIRILVGGYPFSVDPMLAKAFGADGTASDAIRAVRVAKTLFKDKFGKNSRAAFKSDHERWNGKRVPILGPSQNPMEEISRFTSERIALHRHLSKRIAIAEQLNDEKNRFLGMAAHDLRNPLQTILHCTSLLTKDANHGLKDPQLRLIHLINTAATSMSDILDSFLNLSVIEAGKLELRRKATDLVKLVEQRIEMIQVVAKQSGVQILIKGSKDPVIINADPNRIGQVIDNLLSNAIKFSKTNSEVIVQVMAHHFEGVVSIRDQGPGIPLNQQEELFRPFHRLSVTARLRKQGTGLGLHIAKRVIQEHGGKIWVESHPGQGSQFFFSLSLAKSQSLDAA
jgi:signal transduction histidine kinase